MTRDIGDIKWLVGLFEGEGCVVSDAHVRLQIVTTDADVAERAYHLLGSKARLHGPRFQPNQMPAYNACLDGDEAAGWMMTMYSQLGMRRQARVQSCLEDWRARPGKGNKRDEGGKYS